MLTELDGSVGCSCGVVELRQYTLHAGCRDALVTLFERAFVEPQEAVGLHLLGTFEDVDDPDRFVWLRGCRDMQSRQRALAAFYEGPVWLTHRAAANQTMIDSDNVLLLRPTDPPRTHVRTRTASTGDERVLLVTYLLKPGDGELAGWLADFVHPLLERILRTPVLALRTEPAQNTYPALPVRADENAFVWLAAFDDDGECRRALADLHDDVTWRTLVEPRLQRQSRSREQALLRPTSRSALR